MELPMCRLCLTPNSGATALFEEQTMEPNVLLLQKVVECTSIKLIAEEDFPSSLCTDCVGKLNDLSTFKIQCIVNNDFYRKKQAQVRKQMICSQQPTEVVCLDDDDDEEEEEGGGGGGEQDEPPAKKALVVEQVIIDDDEDEEVDQITTGTMVGYNGLLDPTPMYYDEDDSEEPETYNTALDEYELVEGQEQDYQEYLPDEEMDNNAILSSILLDDEDSNSSLLAEVQQGMHCESSESFGCSFCGRRYSSVAKLRTHVKLHSANRMKCFICGKMIVLHLLRHLRSQHPGQVFPQPVRCWHNKCSHLEEVFLDVDQLLEHMDAKRSRK